MAANEVATHINLQLKQDSPYLCKLLGGFEVSDPDSDREQARPTSSLYSELSMLLSKLASAIWLKSV